MSLLDVGRRVNVNLHVQDRTHAADTIGMVTIEVRVVRCDDSDAWAAQAATVGAVLPRTFTYSRRRTRTEALQDRDLVAAWLRSELPPLVADHPGRVVFVE